MHRRIIGLLVVALAHTDLQAQNPMYWHPMPRPAAAPYAVRGGCPFECCGYGAWTLRSAGKIQDRPRPGARVIASLPAGTKLTGDSGHVVMDTLGIAVVVGTPTGLSEGDPPLAAGDTLILLDYGGEGVRRVWARGVSGFLTEWWNYPNANWIRLVRAPVTGGWWAHVTWTVRGKRRGGWLDMVNADVRGVDFCGSGDPGTTTCVR